MHWGQSPWSSYKSKRGGVERTGEQGKEREELKLICL